MLWTTDELKRLYSIVTQNGKKPGIVEFRKAATTLGKSVGSCERKFARTDWDIIVKQEYDNKTVSERKPWTPADDLQLYELRTGDNKYDYQRIGRIMDRTPISCERRFQRNDWKSILGDRPLSHEDVVKAKIDEKFTITTIQNEQANLEAITIEQAQAEHRAKLTGKVVDWLVGAVKADVDELKAMTQEIFDAKLEKMLANPDSKFTQGEVEGDFEVIRQSAMLKIEELGMTYPKTRQLGKGRYVVVGESHGKNTSSGIFKLLTKINEELKPDFIIHIGNISDDDDEIRDRKSVV